MTVSLQGVQKADPITITISPVEVWPTEISFSGQAIELAKLLKRSLPATTFNALVWELGASTSNNPSGVMTLARQLER